MYSKMVSALVYQLRNAKQMRFSVTRDDTGEEYYSNVVENASKSIWYPNYNLFSYSDGQQHVEHDPFLGGTL
ncbi:MAG: hypothetical protein ACLU9S_00830 [Oscillospiraceae bacterium]